MGNGNYLDPRLVALSKDSSLELFFDKWDNSLTFNFIKEALFNEIDIYDKISIKKEYSEINGKDLSILMENANSILTELIKDSLRFVGRQNDAYVEKIDW